MKNRQKKVYIIVLGICLSFLLSPLFICIDAGICINSLLAAESSPKYLFYMHGSWIEKNGLDTPHPRHGDYEYKKIIDTFVNKGFTVISEARIQEVGISEYAGKVVQQVREILERGVPAENITIIGHSKGGQMALIVSSLLEEDDLNFVIMAGCGKEDTRFRRGYDKFLERLAGSMRGRILSLYDSVDEAAGSCQEAFTKAPQANVEEIVFSTGLGHGLFYSPREIWVDEVVNWSENHKG